jgi:AcrR family transcriptional regulator
MEVIERRRYQKRLKPSERRESVLDAALALIARTGDLRVTMAAVAAEAGVTKPIVYDYFANAEALLGALLKREGTRALAVLEQVLPDPSTLPARGDRTHVLLERLARYLQAVQEHPNVWRLTLLPPEGTAPAVRARVEKERELVRQRIAALLSWGLPREARRELDLELLSHAIHAIVQRFARQLILEPGTYTPERVIALMRQLLKLARP